MKLRCFLYFLCLFYAQNLASQVTFEKNDSISLSSFLDIIEDQANVSFSYNSGVLADKIVYIEEGEYKLDNLLLGVLSPVDYYFEFLDEKNIVILPIDNQTSVFVNICGYIKDYQNNLFLSYVNIYTADNKWGTSTDANGYYELRLPRKYDSLTASFIGFENFIISVEQNKTNDCPVILLHEDSETLSTIVMREYLDDGITQSENTKSIVLNLEKMNVLPGQLDNDVFASVLMLPGINSPSESLDGIFIRGGTPDQNLVLYDDIPVYHTSHLFGTISAFNPFFVDEVNVYRSAISSEYGGRVSGVVDIKSKSKIPKKMHFGMGIDMIHAHFDFETPLWKNSALYISFRRSITEIWASPTFLSYADWIFQGSKVDPERFAANDLEFNDLFAFNDANLKWVYNLPKDRFELSTFGTLNKLNYSTALPNRNAFVLDQLDLKNGGAKISWERDWADDLTSNVIITNAEYDYKYDIFLEFPNWMLDSLDRGFSKNRIKDGSFELSFDWAPKEYQNFKMGYQFTENDISFEFGQRMSGVFESEKQTFEHALHTLFGEYSLALPNIVDMDIGLRLQNSPILEKRYFEPRISVVTRLSENMRLKASTSKQFQFVSQLVAFDINDVGFNNQIWVASDEEIIPVIESNQWVGGIIYEKDDWTLDTEGYVKELVGITSFSALSELSAPYAQGKSKVRGIDVLLKRRFKNFRSWISYTLSETLYEFPTIPPGVFPAPHDQQHVLQWVNIYKDGPWEFSVGVNFRTGLPFRDASGIALEENSMGELVPRIQYNELNSSRLGPYFRTDASVIYNFGSIQSGKGFVGMSIQNVTNRANVLGRDFYRGNATANGSPILLSTDELGLRFTPNVSVGVRW